MQWDRETGILMLGEIHGQQIIGRDVSPINIKIEFGKKHHRGLPEEARVGYAPEYVLNSLSFKHEGIDDIAPADAILGIEGTIKNMREQTILMMEITEINGLFFEFDATLFPGNRQFQQGPDQGEGMAFGLGMPFLTPDWEFYTSVMATGNLVIETFTSLVGAVQPTTDMPEFDITQILLDLQVSKENGYRYFGFNLGEEVEMTEPQSGQSVYTKSDGKGWLAYEDDGLFAGFFLKMNGMIQTEGMPTPPDEPKFTEPPSLEDLQRRQ